MKQHLERVQLSDPTRLLLDFALAIALGGLVFGLLELGFFFSPQSEGLDGVSVLLLMLCAGSLTVRSLWPIVTLAGVVTFGSAYLSTGSPVPPVLPFACVALFTLTANSPQPRPVTLAIALSAVAILGFAVLTNRELRANFAWLNDAAWVTAAIFLGDSTRSRRQYTQEAARTRDEEARRRVSEERLQIARELHDVVAHSISIINVQAGAAGFVLDKDAGQAKEALANIKRVSHETLQELRSLVGVLREPRESAPLTPTAGLGSLEQLLRDAHDAGLDVDLSVTGNERHLPGTVDTSAYRILQEALTNAVRHAPGSQVRVALEYGDEEISIDVENSRGADGNAPTPESGGHGLIGMRERVTALGGRLEVGQEADGGFRVKAVLPLPEVG